MNIACSFSPAACLVVCGIYSHAGKELLFLTSQQSLDSRSPYRPHTCWQVLSFLEDFRLAVFLPRGWMSLREGLAFRVQLWSGLLLQSGMFLCCFLEKERVVETSLWASDLPSSPTARACHFPGPGVSVSHKALHYALDWCGLDMDERGQDWYSHVESNFNTWSKGDLAAINFLCGDGAISRQLALENVVRHVRLRVLQQAVGVTPTPKKTCLKDLSRATSRRSWATER